MPDLIGRNKWVQRTLGAMCLAVLMVPAAQAANGRITFHGGVRAPTCSPVLPVTGSVQGATLHACPSAQRPAEGAPARQYSMEVMPMPGNLLDGRVRAYFPDYLQHRGAMKLVVQRFE